MSPVSKTTSPGRALTAEQVAEVVAQACPAKDYRNKKVLLIVPDGTRSAPVGLLFQTLHGQMGEVTKAFDVLVALGTHQPMSETAICQRLEISESERREAYGCVRFFNHAWNDPAALKRIGVIPAEEISRLSNGLFAMDVPVDVNRMVFDYVYKERPFHTILSCAPKMYEEVWTGGKAMYKLEPVLADGGELIIYAPHIAEVCVAHGKTIEEVGYHCRDYFLKQWDRFKHYPWGVLAHCAHVHGLGTFENGVETPRARVTLATQIPPEKCKRINLAYRDPNSIRIEDFANREDEGILLVPKAGEMLYRLNHPPDWAKESL